MLTRLAEAVLQEPGDVLPVVAVERAGRVVVDRALQTPEEVLVVDDVAVLLVVTVQPVHPADRLEEPVITHLLVDVEVRCRGCIKAGQQFVDDD